MAVTMRAPQTRRATPCSLCEDQAHLPWASRRVVKQILLLLQRLGTLSVAQKNSQLFLVEPSTFVYFLFKAMRCRRSVLRDGYSVMLAPTAALSHLDAVNLTRLM